MGIISSFDRFAELVGKEIALNSKSDRIEALKQYFEFGGIISVSIPAKEKAVWPKLLYPTPMRIRQQQKELNDLKDLFESKKRDWKKKLGAAKRYNLNNQVKKFGDSFYWKHVFKKLRDKDYRKDSDKVDLPAHLVADKRYKPMIKMFVNDLDYRKQLTETFENSIVYKQDKKLAKYANTLQDFRKDISSQKIDSIQEKINQLNIQIKVLDELMKWAKE